MRECVIGNVIFYMWVIYLYLGSILGVTNVYLVPETEERIELVSTTFNVTCITTNKETNITWTLPAAVIETNQVR